MPLDSERKAEPIPVQEEGMPLVSAFGRALATYRTGPCSTMLEHCPIQADEVWQPGRCMIDECPRRKAYSLTN